MTALTELMTFVLSYIIVLFIGFFLIQFLSNGFFMKFIKIKASRGKKVLVEVRGRLQHYYVAGVPEGGWLIYRDNEAKREGRKSVKRLALPREFNPFYRKMNVNCVNVDEEKNSIMRPDNLRGIPGYDALKWSNLLKRALMSVKIKDDSKVILAILIIVLLLVLGMIIIFAKLGSLQESIEGIKALTHVTGGNV